MTGPLRYARRLFDALYDATSNETVQHSVYANTRPLDGTYAISNTQSTESTYRNAERTDSDQITDGANQFSCQDPKMCPTCRPVATAD